MTLPTNTSPSSNQATIIFITGTDTDVGKTITTAALAAALAATGAIVAAYKPTQTGVSGDEAGDMGEVCRLSGIHTVAEGIRLQAPMAPVAAAALENRVLPTLLEHLHNIKKLTLTHDHVLVEGAGGLLVELDEQGNTLAELMTAVNEFTAVSIVVVCRAGLGTLNHTQLTLEALAHRGLPAAGLVIGSWPATPTDIECGNRDYLVALDAPLLGALPGSAAGLIPNIFRERAQNCLRLPQQ